MDLLQELKAIVTQGDSSKDIKSVVQVASDQIRKIIKFDRVMIYRFEPNWDGYVIAESKIDKLESFKGLRYPSTDIPPQARKLYFETRYRMIVDINNVPASIMMNSEYNNGPLDLTGSVLRAVSPFHIEYLQNMGLTASFSIPLKINGTLWGLVTCHHYSGPKFLSAEVRSWAELSGQVLVGRIGDLLSEKSLKTQNEIFRISQDIVARATEGNSIIQGFTSAMDSLLTSTNSTGLFIKIGDEERGWGICLVKVYLKN